MVRLAKIGLKEEIKNLRVKTLPIMDHSMDEGIASVTMEMATSLFERHRCCLRAMGPRSDLKKMREGEEETFLSKSSFEKQTLLREYSSSVQFMGFYRQPCASFSLP